MERDITDVLDELETQIANVQTSLELHALIVQKCDRIDKAPGEKLCDYEQIGTLARALFDRLYSEAHSLNALFNELHATIVERDAGGGN